MKPIEVIEAIIGKYNLSFSTRWRVLDQLFLVNGNGCYWKRDGSMDTDTSDYEVGVLSENSTIKMLKESLNLMKDYDCPAITDSYHLKIKFEEGLDKFKQEHFKKIAAHQFFFFDVQRPTFRDLSRASFNHLYYEVPANVQPEWKALIIETSSIVQAAVKESYYLGGELTVPTSWKNEQAYSFYMAAENQLESLK